jgi:hypothetical protein
MAVPTAPGLYAFMDAVGGPAQLVIVRERGGTLLASFPVLGDEEVPVADLLGEFRPMHQPVHDTSVPRR